MIDTHILEKIIDAAEITKDDFVLEIGPGIGTMTQYLCEAAREVVAVEIDTNLLPVLDDTLKEYDNVTVLNEDILKVDIASLAGEKIAESRSRSWQICHITLRRRSLWACLRAMCRWHPLPLWYKKEVADRMQVGPGTKDYAALSLAVQYFAKPEVVCVVPPTCFVPQPKVASSVIRLTCHEKPPVEMG